MSRLDEVELVVTNNLSRARARMQSTSYSNLNDTVEIQRVHNREATAEDDHLLSPRRAKRGYVIANLLIVLNLRKKVNIHFCAQPFPNNFPEK